MRSLQNFRNSAIPMILLATTILCLTIALHKVGHYVVAYGLGQELCLGMDSVGFYTTYQTEFSSSQRTLVVLGGFLGLVVPLVCYLSSNLETLKIASLLILINFWFYSFFETLKSLLLFSLELLLYITMVVLNIIVMLCLVRGEKYNVV
jgi:hypothetical protein